MFLTVLLLLLFAYLVGSISSAILLARLFNYPDPRTQGSKNPGATNILRMSNKYLAAAVLFFDFLKGIIPVWLAISFSIDINFIGLVAIAACLGHMFPIFFNYRGGKAVATALGAMIPLGLLVSIILIIIWLTVIKLTKYASLAAIITVFIAPVLTYFLNNNYTYAIAMLSALIIFRHKDNIVRLIQGTESKVSS